MLKQDKICGWCGETDELTIMFQGGFIDTTCVECGSTRPRLSTNEVGRAYRALRLRAEQAEARVRRLEEFISWIADQHYANGLSKDMIIQKAKEALGAK